jgi:hypothetical protein
LKHVTTQYLQKDDGGVGHIIHTAAGDAGLTVAHELLAVALALHFLHRRPMHHLTCLMIMRISAAWQAMATISVSRPSSCTRAAAAVSNTASLFRCTKGKLQADQTAAYQVQ